jgi:hypothetical protein
MSTGAARAAGGTRPDVPIAPADLDAVLEKTQL